MRITALGSRPRLVKTETEVEQVSRELAMLLHRHPEPLDRTPCFDDGAALLPEGALGAGTELVLADRRPEAAPLRGHSRGHAVTVRRGPLKHIGEAADHGCGRVRIA